MPKMISQDEIRDDAMDVIEGTGPAADALLPLLTNQLNSTNDLEYLKALVLLQYVTNHFESIVPYFAKAVHAKDTDAQHTALFVLSNLGSVARPAMPDLLEVLEDSSSTSDLRRRVVYTCAIMGSNAAPTVPAMKSLFDTEANWGTRSFYASCICRVDSNQRYALDFLVGSLSNNMTPERLDMAAWRLAFAGPCARSSIPTILTAFDATRITNSDIIRSVVQSLTNLGASRQVILPVLKNKLDSESDGVTEFVAKTMLALDPTNRDAEFALIDLIKQHSPDTQAEIQQLEKMGPAAREAIPALKEVVNGTNYLERNEAERALVLIRANQNNR